MNLFAVDLSVLEATTFIGQIALAMVVECVSIFLSIYVVQKFLPHLPSSGELKGIFVEVEFCRGKISVVGYLYHPPSACFYKFTQSLTSIMDAIYAGFSTCDVTLLGDLNVDFFNTKNDLLSDSINLLQLQNLVESPTRITATSSTLIDVILVTAPLFFTET